MLTAYVGRLESSVTAVALYALDDRPSSLPGSALLPAAAAGPCRRSTTPCRAGRALSVTRRAPTTSRLVTLLV